jgi:hypothetical protein
MKKPSPSAVAVFTGKSLDHILEDGGSQSWKLDPHHAKRCEYLVCCRSDVSWVEGPEPKGASFLIGRVSGVEPSTETEGRWLIKISDYAPVDIPEVWQRTRSRNPVHYSTLEDLGIDLDRLTFEPVPEREAAGAPVGKPGRPLTIAEAKRGLAEYFGVSEDAIEITIRG